MESDPAAAKFSNSFSALIRKRMPSYLSIFCQNIKISMKTNAFLQDWCYYKILTKRGENVCLMLM